MVRIGLVQMRCEKGAIDENLRQIAAYAAEATDRGADIIGFPEASITGFADPTRYPRAVLSLDGPEIAQLLHVTRDNSATLLPGLIERNPLGKPFITQVAMRDGHLLGFYRKRTIKNKEVEWFSPGEERVGVFSHTDVVLGVAICADIGDEGIFAQTAREGADIVFELAAPGLYGGQSTRNWRSGFEWWKGECQKYLSQYAREYGVWIAVATQAGRTIDEDFPGGGYLFAPGGRRVYAAPDWSPGVVYLEINLETGHVRPF